jgi:hypothetical protein
VLRIALKWGGVLKGSVSWDWAGVSVGYRPYSVVSKWFFTLHMSTMHGHMNIKKSVRFHHGLIVSINAPYDV